MQNPVLRNVSSGQIIELVKSPFSIGRSLTSDYVIENKIVSRIHCSLTKTEEGWTLTDSSTNGTLVNDGHYKGETSPILKHNDEVSLGYDSYTYRFLTTVEKAPNSQIERLKTQESIVQGNTTTSNERRPSTPNSFDENGVSDDLLNDLADNMLTTVEQHTDNNLNVQTNIPLENLQPTLSKNIVTFNQTEEEICEATPKCSAVCSTPLEPSNNCVNQLNIEENDLGQAASADDENVVILARNKNEESNKPNDNPDGTTPTSSDTSVSTVIYSLPDDIILEMPLPGSDNRAEQASNMIVEQKYDTGTGLVHTNSIKAGIAVENTSINKPSTSSSKPRDLVAESIEAVVRNASDVTAMANTLGTIAQAGLVPSSFNITSNITVPTSVTMASPINANKKVKVTAISSGTVNQLRPLSSTEVLAMMATGQQVNRITQDEMKRILARQPGVPLVVLGQDSTNFGTVKTNTVRSQPSTSASKPTISIRKGRGGITTVTTSTRVSTTSNAGNRPGKGIVLRGVKKVHNTTLPATSTNNIITTLQNNGPANNVITSTANTSTTVLNSIFSFLQSASAFANNTRPQNTPTVISDNTLLPLAQIQNTAATSSRTVTKNTTVQSTSGHVWTAGNQSISTDVTAVPDAVHEVVIESTKQDVSATKCHDSQEPGPSKAPQKLASDGWKQNNQNQYEDMENELMCAICSNLFIKAVTLGCSHSFCQYCIGQWKKKKTECPICRNKITSSTRTLVLDNIIEKMVETASDEDKKERKEAIEERKKMEDEETAKSNPQNASKNTATRGRRRGRGNANTRSNQENNTATNARRTEPVITIVDSPLTTDSDEDHSDDDDDDNSSDNSGYDYDDYYADDWYRGRRRPYYGGYGRCFKCGEQGHWANNCPFR